MTRCASRRTSTNDRPRYQRRVGDIASQASRFGKALDGSAAFDKSVHYTICEAEILYGLALMAAGRRPVALQQAVAAIFAEEFADRVLPFDSTAARAFADIAVRRRRSGRPISELDAQIAATALSHGAAVATRNVEDFTGCGISVVSPWKE